MFHGVAWGEKTLGNHGWGPGRTAARADIQLGCGRTALQVVKYRDLPGALRRPCPCTPVPPLPWWQGDWFRNFPLLESLIGFG